MVPWWKAVALPPPVSGVWCSSCAKPSAWALTWALVIVANNRPLGTVTVHVCRDCGDRW